MCSVCVVKAEPDGRIVMEPSEQSQVFLMYVTLVCLPTLVIVTPPIEAVPL